MTYIDVFGGLIELTDERWLHIIKEHPEAARYKEKIQEVLANPDYVKKSSRDAEVLLYYRFYDDISKGKYILFLNPDTKLFPGTVEKIMEVFSADEKIGIVGPIHVEDGRISDEEHFGFRKTPLSTIRTKIFREKEKSDRQKYFETDWVSGGAMMIRRSLFSELGGFDENYFMYFEDVDLCLQAKKRGWKIAVCPEAKIFHKSGQSFSGKRKKKKYYYNSQSYYIKKNFGSPWGWIVKAARFPFYIKNVWLG